MTTQKDLPDVTAIIPLISQVKPFAEKLYGSAHIEPLELIDFIKKTQAIHLARLDDRKNPLIKKDRNGNESLILMWGHPKNYLDTNFLIGMVCPLSKDSTGMMGYKPATLIRGPLANVMVVGGMSCCGPALQAHWSEVQSGGHIKDESRVPLIGMRSPEHAHWLRGKVDVANTPEKIKALHDMAMDLMAHRLPDDPRFKRSPDAKGDYMAQFYAPTRTL